MKTTFNNISGNPRNLIRRAGYGELRKRNGEVSYTKRLGGGAFPRFHVYIDQTTNGFTTNLHLDQKAVCYGGVSAHSGEYDGRLVEREMARVRAVIEHE